MRNSVVVDDFQQSSRRRPRHSDISNHIAGTGRRPPTYELVPSFNIHHNNSHSRDSSRRHPSPQSLALNRGFYYEDEAYRHSGEMGGGDRDKSSKGSKSTIEGGSSLPKSKSRRQSHSRHRRNKRTTDDDDLSFLSYSTPVHSNTSSRKLSTKAKGGDDSTDVTPIISNLDPNGNGTSTGASNAANNGDPDDATEVISNVQEDTNTEAVSSSSSFDTRSKKYDKDPPYQNSEMSLDSSNRRSTLFRIESGQIPSELASDDPPDGLFPLFNNKPKSRSVASSSIDNEITNLRREMNIDGKNIFQKLFGTFETSLPLYICLLFLIQFILSSHASLSCRFMTCNIGFKPSNINFHETQVDFGYWSFYSNVKKEGQGGGDDTNMKMVCLAYPKDFSNMFIIEDSSWIASRVISIINILIGFFVFIILTVVTSHKIVKSVSEKSWVTKKNARFSTILSFLERQWVDLCLFCTVLLLLWECIKFVFLKANICREEKWMNDRGEMVAGQGCSLSKGGISAIFAIILDVLIVLILFLSDRFHSDDDISFNDENEEVLNHFLDNNNRAWNRIGNSKDKSSDSSGSNRNIDINNDLRQNDDDDTSSQGTMMDINHRGNRLQQRQQNNDEVSRSTNSNATLGDSSFLDTNSLSTVGENEVSPFGGVSGGGKSTSKRQNEKLYDKRHKWGPMVRTSMGFYANVDDSIGMPKLGNSMSNLEEGK